MTSEQVAFGSALRRERERRKVALASVAESIKIKQSLLASLERGDASQWPAGIYRRAFLREYAAALGLAPETVVTEFVRLFPEAGEAVVVAGSSATNDLRLTLAPELLWSSRPLARQVIAVIADSSLVLTIGAVIGLLVQASIWTVMGMVAASYYSLATVCLGRSPALWLISRLAGRPAVKTKVRPSSREVLYIVPSAPKPEVRGPRDEKDARSFVEKARSAS